MKKIIWFMKGYANIYKAISDIKDADHDKNFEIICSHPRENFIGFESADFIEQEPSADCTDEKYLEFCENMLKKYKVDVVFASNKLSLLGANKDLFEKYGCTLVTATSHDWVETIDNKKSLYDSLKEQDIVKIPDYMAFHDDQSFEKSYESLSIIHESLCMKPTIGVYGLGFYKIEKEDNTLKRIFDQSKNISVDHFKRSITGKSFNEMILMQYLEGEERSVDCVAYNGQLIGGITRVKLQGIGQPQKIENNLVLLEQVKYLVGKLKLNGLFNIQFKDHNNAHYLLEINLRMSGRAFYATVGGLNLPYTACNLFSGLKKPQDIHYEVNDGLLIHAYNDSLVLKKR